MDQISESRLQQVFPALASKVRQMAAALIVLGVEIRVVQVLRTWEEQQALYEIGRSTPGKKVTNCCGGMSYHNFGLAVDCVPSQFDSSQPFAPDWNSSHPDWRNMISVGKSLGLCSGADWRTFPDFPHFQLTGRFPEGAPSNEVRRIFNAGGLQAVWDEVSKSLPQTSAAPEVAA